MHLIASNCIAFQSHLDALQMHLIALNLITALHLIALHLVAFATDCIEISLHLIAMHLFRSSVALLLAFLLA